MWEATKTKSEDRDRKFFLTGILALGLLGYGALLSTTGTPPLAFRRLVFDAKERRRKKRTEPPRTCYPRQQMPIDRA